MPLTRTPMTWKLVLQYPEDGCRHELLDGDHVMTPAPSYEHQSAVAALLAILREYLRASGRGKVVASPIDVVLSEFDLVQPDIVVLFKDGPASIEEGRIHGAPDIVVEVLSPSTRERDLGRKRVAYHKAGVASYWVVDAQARTVVVLAWSAQGYETELIGAAGELLRIPTLPGLQIPVDELFEA